MSIELSIKQIVEEQVQKVTGDYIEQLNSENYSINQKLNSQDSNNQTLANKINLIEKENETIKSGLIKIENELEQSITLSIKQGVEDLVQKITRAYIERLNSENYSINQKLKWTEKKLEETLSKLSSHNNIISDRELSGDKIDSGTITNFASTGIDDNASKKRVTVSDDKIMIENDVEIKGKITCATLYYTSAKADNLDVLNSVRINSNEVLWKDRLGNSVTKSKLQEVGVLTDLNVADTFYAYKNKVGINTNNPTGVLGLVKDGIEITTDVIGSVAYVGTVNSDDFSIGSSSQPTLFISHDNRVGIKVRKPKADLDVAGPIRFQGQIHQYDSNPPVAGTYSQGDIVWNTRPVTGSVLGWVCVKAGSPGTWIDFVSIE